MPYGPRENYYRNRLSLEDAKKKLLPKLISGKKKLVAWMASNCNFTTYARSDYVAQLQKNIQVDVYGACGPLKCGKNTKFPDCSKIT